MTKNKIIVICVIAALLFMGMGLVTYQYFSVKHSVVNIVNSDDKIIQAARASLQFIDNFYKEKGYYPCEDDFYITFWNRNAEFRDPIYNDAGHAKVDYRPYCNNENTKPQKFVSLCYNLRKENAQAFGYKYYPSPFGSGSVNYCVASPGSDPKYPDYKQFLIN